MTLHRRSSDTLQWIIKFQMSRSRMQEALDSPRAPITNVNSPEATITAGDALVQANERLRGQQHSMREFDCFDVVSLADLTQDQPQLLTSLMARRNLLGSLVHHDNPSRESFAHSITKCRPKNFLGH